jgi:hypothetical protein
VLVILMIAVMFLPLNGLGHVSAVHGAGVELSLADHDHGHSHDFDDDDMEIMSDESDHHHADHTHEKASTPPSLHHATPLTARVGFTTWHDQSRPDRLYAVDRPPRPLTLA